MTTAELRQLIERLRYYAEATRLADDVYGSPTTRPDDLALAADLLEAALEAAVFVDADALPVQGSRPS